MQIAPKIMGPKRHRFDDDRGIVAIFTALFLVVLMGSAALSVDIGREYSLAAQLQKAADAASLAGAVYLPDNLALARSTADTVARANVRSGAGGPIIVTSTVGTKPTQLRVTVTAPMSFVFGPAIGRGSTTVSRTAVADFAGPTPMGSPCNVFGREDMAPNGQADQSSAASANCAGAGTYWVDIAGANVNKARGDAYADKLCTAPDDGVGIDNCSIPNSSAANPGINSEYDPNGYIYIVRVTQAGTLNLQGYDIAWAATNDTCNDNMAGASTVTNTYVTDSATRYAASGNEYCPGDTQMKWSDGDLSSVRTDVIVRDPATTSLNPLDGAQRCSRSWNGWGTQFAGASTPANQNPAVVTPLSLKDKLDSSKGTYDAALAEVFHRWAGLCSSGSFAVTPGDYSIQVKTVGGGGQNRFGLRAQFSGGGGNNAVSIFAAGKAAFFNNVPAGTSNFFLVRLNSGTSSHQLKLRFFDLGDADKPVSATVLQPDNSTLATGQPWSNCTGTGPRSGPIANCTVTTTRRVNGGRWQTISMPIPASYRCNADGDQSKCWVKIRLTTTSRQSDTTTWSAALDGDPVRIIQ